MPVEFRLELQAEKEVFLPLFTGHIARGLLLHMLQQVNPAISIHLHEPNVPKPYSVTPLYFKSKSKTKEGYTLDPAFPCRLKMRFLEDEYVPEMLKYFNQKSTILIFDTFFHISSLSISIKEYATIIKESKNIEAFRLYFKTPTYLASLGAGFHCLFPDPQKVFLSLMRLWNQYSTTKKHTEEEVKKYRDWLVENLGVTQHKLQTQLVIMKVKKVTGFMGWTTYKMKKMDTWNKTTSILARFAEYSNVGGNRTAGFGVVKFVPSLVDGLQKTSTC